MAVNHLERLRGAIADGKSVVALVGMVAKARASARPMMADYLAGHIGSAPQARFRRGSFYLLVQRLATTSHPGLNSAVVERLGLALRLRRSSVVTQYYCVVEGTAGLFGEARTANVVLATSIFWDDTDLICRDWMVRTGIPFDSQPPPPGVHLRSKPYLWYPVTKPPTSEYRFDGNPPQNSAP